jgi:hypothetical protein
MEMKILGKMKICRMAWGLLACLWIKETILGFQFASRWRSAECLSTSIWVDYRVPEYSAATSTGRLMSGGCWFGCDSAVCTCGFLWPFDFRGSVTKLCWLLPSGETIPRSMVKSDSREYHGSQDLRTSNCGLSHCDDVELDWWFMAQSSSIESGGDNTGKVQSHTF